jgi:hypothetical protein
MKPLGNGFSGVIDKLPIFEANILANTISYAKRFQPVNQGPWLNLKMENRESGEYDSICETVSTR